MQHGLLHGELVQVRVEKRWKPNRDTRHDAKKARSMKQMRL